MIIIKMHVLKGESNMQMFRYEHIDYVVTESNRKMSVQCNNRNMEVKMNEILTQEKSIYILEAI